MFYVVAFVYDLLKCKLISMGGLVTLWLASPEIAQPCIGSNNFIMDCREKLNEIEPASAIWFPSFGLFYFF